MLGYLTHQKQKAKLVLVFSTWFDIGTDVLSGSLLVSSSSF